MYTRHVVKRQVTYINNNKKREKIKLKIDKEVTKLQQQNKKKEIRTVQQQITLHLYYYITL